MRSHAKASSEGSTLRRGKHSLGAFAAVLVCILVLVPLAQAKTVVGGFGPSKPEAVGAVAVPTFGGQFSAFFGASGVAVNNAGNGASAGTVYVADPEGRVQRFDSSGEFQRAWGQDVIASSVNELQRIVVKATAGTYTLTFDGETTDPIPYSVDFANPNSVREMLGALPSINGTANVNVGGSNFNNNSATYLVSFQGALGGSDQPLLTVDTSGLTGTVTISTLADGETVPEDTGTGFEICTVVKHCKAGAESDAISNGGQLNEPQGVAVDQATGNVYVTEEGNRRVSEFDADGNFIRAFGWDVVEAGGSGDVSTDAFEICTVAADCKQGESGENGGQFGTQIGYPVVDGSGNVWVPDASNRRIQEFDSSGNFVAAYGYDVDTAGGGGAMEKCTSTALGACRAGTEGSAGGQFSFNSPRQVAFDNLGNLYAIDAGNNRVQKFDPTLLASASDFGGSTISTYTTQAPQQLIATQGGTRLVFSVVNGVTGGGEHQLLEIDPTDASVKDTSLVGSKLSNVNGLGANTTSGDLYATNAFTSSVGSNSRRIYILGSTAPPDPAIALSPVLVKGATTAIFTGKVDPKGGLVSCAFQYSTNEKTWTDVAEPDCTDFTGGGGIQVVAEGVVGLVPATHYFVRLSVSRPLMPGSTKTTAVQEFDTVVPAPSVSGVGSMDIQNTSARLSGTINPNNSITGYVFEYGTTPALGSSTPPLNIGGGTSPVIVSQVVNGLTPDTTYYFRLVATNVTGSTGSPQKSFHTRVEPLPLPDSRAYEMVTPADKNGGDAYNVLLAILPRVAVAADGKSVGFCTISLFGENPGQFAAKGCSGNISQRETSGWTTRTIFPRYCRYNTADGTVSSLQNQWLNPGMTRAVVAKYEPFGCPLGKFDPAAPFSPVAKSANLYLQDLSGEVNEPAAYRLVAPQVPAGEGFVDASDDLSHIFFRSVENQTAPPDSPAPGNFRKLYEWVELGPDCNAGDLSYRPDLDACLRLVGKDSSNEPLTGGFNLAAVESITSGSEYARNAVSEDGRRIYFATAVPSFEDQPAICKEAGCKLFMREDGATTFDLGESECTDACDAINSAVTFQWATPDGATALISSCDRLTNAAIGDGSGTSSCQLYRWTRDLPPGARLTSLGYSAQPLGMSDDGNIIYTYGDSNSLSPQSGEKVRRWRWNGGDPEVDVLATLTVTGPPGSSDQAINARYLNNRVTPDGEYLLLNVLTPLDPVADTDADRDAYRWDEENGWICVSCQLPGVASAGNTNLGTAGYLSAELVPDSTLKNRVLEPKISADGQRIFFDTPDALVPEDVNGEEGCPAEGVTFYISYGTKRCSDVYEWHDGRVSLITTGTSGTTSILIGPDLSGESVLFYTRQKLVGWDVDNNVDIYSARVGGGFPEPPPQPAGCEGESCRGAGSLPAAVAGAGTAVFQGPGNPKPEGQARKTCPKGKRKVRRSGRVRCVSGKAKKRNANRNRRAAR